MEASLQIYASLLLMLCCKFAIAQIRYGRSSFDKLQKTGRRTMVSCIYHFSQNIDVCSYLHKTSSIDMEICYNCVIRWRQKYLVSPAALHYREFCYWQDSSVAAAVTPVGASPGVSSCLAGHSLAGSFGVGGADAASWVPLAAWSTGPVTSICQHSCFLHG
jgi:hypothetical protein